MIIKLKPDKVPHYKAIQFNWNEAKESLMNYPGVTKEGTTIRGTTSFYVETLYFYLGDYPLTDGDWILTNDDGKSFVITDKTMKSDYMPVNLEHKLES